MNVLKLEPAKYLRLFSDMHLDFHVTKKFNPNTLWMPEPLPEDKDTILVLAGDLWHAKKPFAFNNYSWMKVVAERFKYVFVVLGNHDFWGGHFPMEYQNFDRYKEAAGIENVYLLQDSIIVAGDYKFVGATLWTDFGSRNMDVIDNAQGYGDFRYIKYTSPVYRGTFKKLQAKNLLEAHSVSKKFIFENAHKETPEQKVWVITHHPPTFALVNDPHLNELTLGVTASNFDEEIKSSQVDVWMHGHSHQSGEAMVGNTKIIANTVGYLSASALNKELNPLYNPWFQLTL